MSWRREVGVSRKGAKRMGRRERGFATGRDSRSVSNRRLGFETLEQRRVLTIAVDLLTSADTGRSSNDNITQHIEQGDLVYVIPAQVGNLQRLWVPGSVRAFVNGLPIPELGAAPSLTERAYNEITLGSALPDGDYQISVVAEYTVIEVSVPPAISSDLIEETIFVTVDSIPPTGSGQLHPDSVTGLGTDAQGHPITSDRTPTFYGVGEANSLVSVQIDGEATGTTVAMPFDGDDLSLEGLAGNWVVTSNRELADGRHQAVFTFEDVAGNQFSTAPYVFLVDSHAPQVNRIRVNSAQNSFNLFDPNPADGPTPAVNALVIEITDLPIRTNDFQVAAVFAPTASERSLYQLVGDANGNIPIRAIGIEQTSAPTQTAAVGYITLEFYEPLPDDRYTLTILDNLVDYAGNHLDGESSGRQPLGTLTPSGDGQPGGDFVARFTVDSRAEIGIFSGGSVYLDTNGNYTSDWYNADAVNRDLLLTLGFVSDHVFTGDFDGSGFDQLAAYRRVASGFQWVLTDDQFAEQSPRATNGEIGIPVAGEFNGNPLDGDEVGIFTGTHWRLDTSNPKDYRLDTTVASGARGLPIVGNFDGFGGDDFGVYNANTNTFYLSLDSQKAGGLSNGAITTTFKLGSAMPFFGVRERPVAADMDADGIDDLGLWVPDQQTVSPTDSAEWYFLISGSNSLASRVSNGVIAFQPRPFGRDVFARFGNEFSLPLVGNFSLPLAPAAYRDDAESPALQDEDSVRQEPQTAEQAVTTPAQDLLQITPEPVIAESPTSVASMAPVISSAEAHATSPRFIVQSRTETRDADGDLISTTEKMSATNSVVDPDTGEATQITTETTATRDAAGNLLSSRQTTSQAAVTQNLSEGSITTTVTVSETEFDAVGNAVTSSHSVAVTSVATDPVTGVGATTSTTRVETRDAQDNILSVTESTVVVRSGSASESGVPQTVTNSTTVTRGPSNNVLTRSESESVTRVVIDPDSSVPNAVTVTNTITTDASGNVLSTSESREEATSGVDQETGSLSTTETRVTTTRDAFSQVVMTENEQIIVTQGIDPDTAAPRTTSLASSVTRDGDGNVIESTETTSSTRQQTDSQTGELVTTTNDHQEQTDAGGATQTTDQSTVTRVLIDGDATVTGTQQNSSTVVTSADSGETAVEEVAVSDGQAAPVALQQQTLPATANSAYPWHNAVLPADVNGDSIVTPRDVLAVLLMLGHSEDGLLSESPEASAPLVDVNQDGFISPKDALLVIAYINAQQSGEGEADTLSAGVITSPIATLAGEDGNREHADSNTSAGLRNPSEFTAPAIVPAEQQTDHADNDGLWSEDTSWGHSQLEGLLDDIVAA